MRNVIFGLCGIAVILFIARYIYKSPKQQTETTIVTTPTQAYRPAEEKKKELPLVIQKSLFVPYWNATVDQADTAQYDTFIYFGITTNKEGSIAQDDGFNSVDDFITSTHAGKKYLTVRMLDTDTNLAVLADSKAEKALITNTIEFAKTKGFDGIVLDLELSALPFSEVKNSINMFVQDYAEAAHESKLKLAMTMYGDVYYRSRPYDLKVIGSVVDGLMIMAYDFHKSYGEPGPNFPLGGQGTYGYDFKTMITDITKVVAPEKMTVLFGLYGYDWTLGPQGKPLKGAKALPLADVQKMILPTCSEKSCVVKKDTESTETKVTYKDEDGYDHIVWFEDTSSVAAKSEYLKEQGIGSVGYWVYGYW